jgi:5-methylcytosine-specific restriction enzyme subunit McrC
MKHLAMSAWGTMHAELTHSEAAEVGRSGLVEVSVEPQANEWRLRSASRVGVAVGDGWELRVRPKLNVPKLMFLLSYARDPVGWKNETADFAFEPELVPTVANAFATHAARAIERGVLRGYVHVDDRLSTIRGRVRFGDQLARGGGLRLPVDVSYDDYTVDVIENQLLKTAATVLLRLARVPDATRRRLHSLRSVLDEVSLLSRPRDASVPVLTRLNERYARAMRLAELVLRSSSLDALVGEIHGTAFSFDMNAVFEDFLTTALREALIKHGGEVRAQWTGALDIEEDIRIQPDITWWVHGRCAAIVDAKYKALDSAGVRNADAYQMLAYCTALRQPIGFLVYARDSRERSRNHRVRNSACEVRVRTVDLETPPEELLQQVGVLADEIGGCAAIGLAA